MKNNHEAQAGQVDIGNISDAHDGRETLKASIFSLLNSS
jgi:hypothetical protein